METVILLVVGVKMLLAEQLRDILGRHFNLVLLLVILGILAAGVIGSLAADRRKER